MNELERIARTTRALKSTVTKLRGQIENSHEKGNIPSDYSLGFTNALIFAEHKLAGANGEPVFYNRATSIGKLPIPVALRTQEEIQAEFRTPAQIKADQELDDAHDMAMQAAWEVCLVFDEMMALGDKQDASTEKKMGDRILILRQSMEKFMQLAKEQEESGAGNDEKTAEIIAESGTEQTNNGGFLPGELPGSEQDGACAKRAFEPRIIHGDGQQDAQTPSS